MSTQTSDWTHLIRGEADRLRRILPALSQVNPGHSLEIGLADAMARMDRPFVLAVVGEYRSGKSTLINALLGQDVALTDVLETTATLNEYAWGETVGSEVIYQDGRREACTVQELNARLDRQRHDAAWLGTVERCRTTVPSPLLKKITLWDSPGFGGSDHNQARAEAFLKDLDAAIWVFDTTVLGQGALAPLLAEMRQRGKAVVGLLNKAEQIDKVNLARAESYLRSAYRDVAFERVIPFSARLACAGESGGATPIPDTGGGLAGDGGRAALLNYLQNDLLAAPETLRLRGVAGDVGRIAFSAADGFSAVAAHLDRRLYLCRRQIEEVKGNSLRVRNELSTRFREELPLSIEDASIAEVDGLLEAVNWRDILPGNALESKLRETLSAKFYRDRVTEYFTRRQPEIEEAWNRLGQSLDLSASIETPFEHQPEHFASVAQAVQGVLSQPVSQEGDQDIHQIATKGLWGSIAAGGAGTLLAGMTGHVVIAGLCATLGGLVAGGAIALFALLARGKLKSAFDRGAEGMKATVIAKLRERIRQPLHDGAGKVASEVIDPYLDRIHEAVLQNFSLAVQRQTLGGQEIPAVLRAVEDLKAQAQECQASYDRLRSVSQVAMPAPAEEPVTLRADQGADGQRWLHRVFDEAQGSLAIVDRDLGPQALELLRLAAGNLPIQVLTYTYPMSSGLIEPFRDAAARLRERSGSLRIRVPYREQSQDCPLADGGCWILTGEYCYHLDRSLNLFGSADIRVEVARDTGVLMDEHFRRWWENRVAGVQTIDF